MYKRLGVYNINSEITCGDLVSEQNFQRLNQLLLLNKAVPTSYLQFVSLFSSAKEDEGELEVDEEELEKDEGELEEEERELEENEVVLEDC